MQRVGGQVLPTRMNFFSELCGFRVALLSFGFTQRLFIMINQQHVLHAASLNYDATLTIHPTPKRSLTIPKRDDQKVFVSGICTCPPSARAANFRSASASFGTASEREKPWKLVCPVQCPSEAITVESPTRKLTCMILFSEPGGTIPGCGGSGLSLKRMSMVTSAPRAFL